jgi:hypothetical protein
METEGSLPARLWRWASEECGGVPQVWSCGEQYFSAILFRSLLRQKALPDFYRMRRCTNAQDTGSIRHSWSVYEAYSMHPSRGSPPYTSRERAPHAGHGGMPQDLLVPDSSIQLCQHHPPEGK